MSGLVSRVCDYHHSPSVVTHPVLEYIPQIYDYFVTLDGSVEVLVMEAFDHSLWSLSHLPLLSMTDDAFCGLALTLCTILDKLHKCGFVHLDIKPENILVRLDSTSTSITKIVLCDVYTATRIAALHFFMDGGTLSYLSLWSHHRTSCVPSRRVAMLKCTHIISGRANSMVRLGKPIIFAHCRLFQDELALGHVRQRPYDAGQVKFPQ